MSLSSSIAPHLPYLRRFSRAVSGSQTSGDALVAAGVKLCSVYGATELGSVTKAFEWEPQGSQPPVKTLQEWEWVQISDLCQPIWDPQGDGTFELKFRVSCYL